MLAYAISPTRGSEYSVAWNYIKEISKHYDVDVLYGASGEHLGDCSELEDYLKCNVEKGINFVKVAPTPLQNVVNGINKAGIGYAFYIAFRLWHKSAFKVAQNLTERNCYALVHQLNPIGFREPGYLYRLGIPFIWGPIGGGNFINYKLLSELPFQSKLFYMLKNCLNYMQLKFSFRVKEALSKADALIFCNSENLKVFNKYHAVKGAVMSEQAIAEDVLEKAMKVTSVEHIQSNSSEKELNLIWVGRLCPGKNISFLLDVMAYLIKNINVKLTVIGDGELRDIIKKQANDLGISDNVHFTGLLTREEILIELSKADLHCLCSLSEANTTVLYEAFSVNTPTISLAQNGMLDTLSDDKGFLIPIKKDLHQTKQLFAEKIIFLSQNKEYLDKSRACIYEQRYKLSWKYKGEKLHKLYKKVIETKR